jgi:CubicO group peptidase (beta-lactamase class C family)
MRLAERIRAAAERHVGETRVPGLVALVAQGDEVHVEALGKLAIGGAPVSRDSLFRIASTTKPITAAATLAVLFEPLGMRDTAFWTSETARLATAYMAKPDGLVVWDEPDGQWSRSPAFGDGAAGLVSTADDLLAFSRMLLGGGAGVLPPAAVRAM